MGKWLHNLLSLSLVSLLSMFTSHFLCHLYGHITLLCAKCSDYDEVPSSTRSFFNHLFLNYILVIIYYFLWFSSTVSLHPMTWYVFHCAKLLFQRSLSCLFSVLPNVRSYSLMGDKNSRVQHIEKAFTLWESIHHTTELCFMCWTHWTVYKVQQFGLLQNS